MAQQDVNAYASAMYARVNEKWRAKHSDLYGGACGFSILSGPPTYNPDLLIIGENPGFGADDHVPHIEATWPSRSYIADATWPLARKLRSIFAAAGHPAILDNSLQTNFLFFKSSSLSREGRYRWIDVLPAVRAELEAFCAHELAGLIKTLKPKLVLVLGLSAFDRHAQGSEVVLKDGSGKRRLLATGIIHGFPTVAIMHPTGAQVSTSDWARVSEWMWGRLGQCCQT